jgi:hypothetical protein
MTARFEIFSALIAVLSDMMPCSLVEDSKGKGKAVPLEA